MFTAEEREKTAEELIAEELGETVEQVCGDGTPKNNEQRLVCLEYQRQWKSMDMALTMAGKSIVFTCLFYTGGWQHDWWARHYVWR